MRHLLFDERPRFEGQRFQPPNDFDVSANVAAIQHRCNRPFSNRLVVDVERMHEHIESVLIRTRGQKLYCFGERVGHRRWQRESETTLKF